MDFNILDVRKARRARRLFQQLKRPIHFIPGNHDVLQGQKQESDTAFRHHFGELSSHVEYSGVVFLLIDSSELAAPSTPAGVQRTLATIEAELRSTAGKPVLVFQHAPSIEHVRQSGFLGGWSEESRRAWHQLLNAYQVKAVIAGHCHQPIHHWHGEVPLYVSPSVVFRQPACRVFEYKAGRLAYWTLHVQPRQRIRDRLRDVFTTVRHDANE